MAKKKSGFWSQNINAVKHPEDLTGAQRNRTKGLLIGMFVGITLFAVIAVTVRVVAGTPPESHSIPAPPTAHQTTTPTPAAVSSSCRNDTATDISSDPPNTSGWEIIGFFPVPRVAGAGPCLSHEGSTVGFSHTMTGALVAASHYTSNLNVDAPTTRTPALLSYALVPGDLTDRLAKKVTAILNHERPGTDTQATKAVEPIGYTVASYSPDEAVIEVVYESVLNKSMDNRFFVSVRLTWSEDDWRIVPATSEDWMHGGVFSPGAPFVPWGPSAQDGWE
ncbi:hypothetical protein [Lysinibacter sp. HNR]|uniref:hypothetical protein n=1 Tax=Lysinibacter sp. HNR TaxID=3031408 RepID=UPI0024355AC2|nr:hypothetical protein [Lysinibacter sp. HNR]WGD37577.1 hypothetical protein FrondiHNR_01235 [Lysinibacter sp. HNR]